MIEHRKRKKKARGFRVPLKYGSSVDKRITVSMEPVQFEAVSNIAFHKRTPVASVIREAVKQYLEPRG